MDNVRLEVASRIAASMINASMSSRYGTEELAHAMVVRQKENPDDFIAVRSIELADALIAEEERTRKYEHDEPMYGCRICGKMHDTKQEFQKHITQFHP